MGQAGAPDMRRDTQGSKASLNRSRHPAEETTRQAVVIPQHEGNVHGWPDVVHGQDITIQD